MFASPYSLGRLPLPSPKHGPCRGIRVPLEGSRRPSVPHIVQVSPGCNCLWYTRTFSNSLTPVLRLGGQEVLCPTTAETEGPSSSVSARVWA